MESLRIGGAEKSLVTILSMLDYSKYDVDLFLFDHGGEFMDFLPKEVNLLNKSENYRIFSQNRKLERKCIYFNVDKVKSYKKIGFIHNNYKKYQYDYKNDKRYFSSYQKIATVSDYCKDVLMEIFPEYKEKFLVIKNMVSKQMIRQMAEEKLEIEKKEKITITTVGRLVEQKGIDNAIDICK